MKFPNPLKFSAAMLRLLWAFITRRPVLVSPQLCDERSTICRTDCPHYDPDSDQCKLCTCFISFKTMLATERCPVGRWKRFWGF